MKHLSTLVKNITTRSLLLRPLLQSAAPALLSRNPTGRNFESKGKFYYFPEF